MAINFYGKHKMAGVNECFSIGSVVMCTNCFDEEIEGEVLGFEPTTKMLILSILLMSRGPQCSVTILASAAAVVVFITLVVRKLISYSFCVGHRCGFSTGVLVQVFLVISTYSVLTRLR